MDYKSQSYANQAKSIIKNLEKRNMKGYYCESGKEALELVKSLIPKGASVTNGGSETLVETGIMDLIQSGDYHFIDRKSAKTPEESRALFGQIVTADYFLMSSNAITAEGELINVDGVGNRVACLINGPAHVYVERHGKLELTDQTFMDEASVMAVIERIVAPLGRRIDESQPYVDARLQDGSRVNAIIPPLSLIGPCVTIRKFAKRVLTAEDFVRIGTWTEAIAGFLRVCVLLRKNIVVAGGTGSGKTTLLNVLSGFIPHSDRILTIEDAAELRLNQPHVVRLEARPPNIEGKGAVTIRDLVRNALRMRPDRIIVGECRGGEALDMLQAMNTGHDGSLTTVHANSPRDVISRLETMVLMSGVELPSRAIREQIASAVNIIVQEARLADGSRRIVAVSEITGMEGQQIVMQDLFAFRQTGVDEDGKILGTLGATGAMPTFYDTLSARGLSLDPALFQPGGSP